MKFFMLSKCGEGAGLLYRLCQEGNDCSISIKEKDYSSVYDGLLKKEKEPEEGAIIIVDSSGLGKEADGYKNKGFHVFGGSEFADELECDREYGLDFMECCGIQIPKTENFISFKKGLRYAKERNTKLAFKPSGNLPCKLTFCGEPEELITYMKFVEQYYGKEIDEFVLQDFVEGKIISTEFWCGKNGFIKPANHTIEVKKFMNNDLGPSTGCQGNLVWVAEDDSIVNAMLKAEPNFVKENYIGPIDLNAIVNEDGIFGLEWTPRFGLDAMPSFIQLVGDVGELIYNCVTGSVHSMNSLDHAFSAGIRLTIPPYPAEPKSAGKLEKEVPSVGVPLGDLFDHETNAYMYEVKLDKERSLVHSDGTGVIAVISDVADDPEEAFRSVYAILDEIKIPDKQYRTDLDEVIPEMYKEVMEVLDHETIRT